MEANLSKVLNPQFERPENVSILTLRTLNAQWQRFAKLHFVNIYTSRSMNDAFDASLYSGCDQILRHRDCCWADVI